MGSSTVMYDDASSPVTFKGEDAKNLVNGVSAKAWVNFNGTGTVAIRNSFNVSSITDVGVGLYTLNITTPLPSANSVVTGIASSSNPAARDIRGRDGTADDTTTAIYLNIVSGQDAQTEVDCERIMISVFSN